MDFFTGVQSFVGGSGTNLFQSIGTGDYTFNGQGTNNTLDYSADPSGVTVTLSDDTVTKNLIILGAGTSEIAPPGLLLNCRNTKMHFRIFKHSLETKMPTIPSYLAAPRINTR